MNTLIKIVILTGLPMALAIAEPDVEVQKSVNNKFPIANESVEFTVQIGNIGDQVATDVIIVDQLPPELVIPDGMAAFPSIGSYDPATGEWVIGDLDAGAEAVLVVPAVVTEPLPPACIVNTALSEYSDVVDDNNDESRAAIHKVGVERCVDLDVRFGISASPILALFPTCDSEERYEGNVSLTNLGPDSARDVVVTITQDPVIGPNLRFDDADCNNVPAPECNIAEITTGETITIDVTSDLYQSHTSFMQTLVVSATTSDFDYVLSNDSPSASGSAGGFSSCVEPDFGIPDPFVGPGCFIATAAYGTTLDSRLDSLRNFRDRFLMPNRLGRAMVSFYYRHSPPIADYIADRNWLRKVVRGLLAPVVFTIENPGLSTFALLAFIAAIRAWRRRLSMWPKMNDSYAAGSCRPGVSPYNFG